MNFAPSVLLVAARKYKFLLNNSGRLRRPAARQDCVACLSARIYDARAVRARDPFISRQTFLLAEHSPLFALPCLLLGMLPFAVGESDEWRFVLPRPGAEHEHPPLRAVPLSAEKPDDLKEKAEYRGASRRYAQLRYGSPGAARVAVAIDEISGAEADLYVDFNRNRTIEARERFAGEGRTWRVPLDVEYIEGEVIKRYPRELIFRRGTTGRTLSFAAAGYLEGRAVLGEDSAAEPQAAVGAGENDRKVQKTVRRMDGDGNGFFTDPQDRLWIDLNGDGIWDPVSEQFLFATILTIDGARYAVRSDERGTLFSLGKLEGTGVLRLVLPERSAAEGASETDRRGGIVEAAVTLVGRDGSAIGLRGLGASATAPIGDYRVSALTVAFDDPQGGPRWTFVFSDNGQETKRWYKLERDAEIEIAPLEKLEFFTGCQAKSRCRPGEAISVQPQLFTADGLLINTCYRGSHDTGRDGVTAQIRLENAVGQSLSSALSGFA